MMKTQAFFVNARTKRRELEESGEAIAESASIVQNISIRFAQ